MIGQPDDKPGEPRLIPTLRQDVGQVAGDFWKRGVRRSFGRAFDDLGSFYLSRDTQQRLAKLPFIPRVAQEFWLLLRGLLMKLTPTRRVLLALALLLLIMDVNRIDAGSVHLTMNFRLVGNLVLLFVLMLELKDKLMARGELEAGRVVQLALLPQGQPAVRGWDIWIHTEPANDVGGDLVDYLAIDEATHAVVLGDVAGKALPAALLMVKLQATLRALIPQFGALSDLGAGVNRILARDGLPNRFATLIYLVLTSESGAMRLLNAGHPPPLVARVGAGPIDELPSGSIALGIMPDATFVEQQVALATGDVLVAYSDGVTEAANAQNEFFGEDRLKDALRQNAGQPAGAIGETILRALAAFVGDAPQYDDISLVVVRRTSAS